MMEQCLGCAIVSEKGRTKGGRGERGRNNELDGRLCGWKLEWSIHPGPVLFPRLRTQDDR